MSGGRGALERTISAARAARDRCDHGAGRPLTWDECLEATQHPLGALTRAQLVEVATYLAAQLVGAQRSLDADAALAMSQIGTVVDEFRNRKDLADPLTGSGKPI